MDNGDVARLIYLGLLLVAVGGWVLVEYRGRLGFALRTAMAWGLIFVGVMAGYGLWNDIRQSDAPQQMMAEGGAVVLPRAPDGHYYLTLTIDGTPLEFLVDTGATSVVLSRDDARKLGIDPATLAYLGEANTANGPVRTARVTLSDVTLGDVVDARLPAYVNDGAMDGSLLGMEYLGRFRIEIDGDRMVLTR
ncbi:MAG: retropepsin-like aspartic protease family protein [Gemmobacter sp.]